MLITADRICHVMNRSARRLQLFSTDDEYQVFLGCLVLGLQRVSVRLLAYCVMPNHFHLVVWPRERGDLARFMKLVTGTHSLRWHGQRGSSGTGCVYQGRYRAVVVEGEGQFLTVCRYVERNPLRAELVRRAEDWPWSSAGQRFRNCHAVPVHAWPILQPSDWLSRLNEPERWADVDVIRTALRTGRPEGVPAPIRGRPRKKGSGAFLRST
jgi:putative transposase